MLYFLKRCQQFTGPLAAKGVEDTSFYIYNRLVSHNEVGDSPENFGITIDEFHKSMLARRSKFPLRSMLLLPMIPKGERMQE
jgi:(1->4)-alpha-D-glucan 1-alpha-D-glucosylmutase